MELESKKTLIQSTKMNQTNQKITSLPIFLLCPVPEEQKPIFQFISLKAYFLKEEDSFKKFQPFEKKNRKSRFLPFHFDLFQKIQSVFLFISWKEVEKGFDLPIISYEEASWYDGQIWPKSFFILKKDQLLNTQFVSTKKINIKKE